ncbi:hypothetical protein PsorP6_011256 [Peronosclerospora sorghi]|uniref:Uncharacterized protein n=1 Tax=Peronosclerospora sorghi TaxID=230839 RepID=A0ACC0WLJ0_9STRA|nr:hypothetical protein PsorP6_011256 [Peronosclerospora sorghi]
MTIEKNQGGETILGSNLEMAQQTLDLVGEHHGNVPLGLSRYRRPSNICTDLFKNAHQRCIETLHLHINLLQYLQAITTAAYYGDYLAQTRADLNTKQAHYSSRQQFASDLGASERCSKFFFRPPQVLHQKPVPVDSAEELEPLCSQFSNFWSGLYCSPYKEFGHRRSHWDLSKLSRLLV